MTWFFVRHGQSIYNLENKFTGWHNPSLSELGKKQALETAKKLSKYDIDIIYSSALSRSKETAEIIIRNHPGSAKDIISDQLLNERNYGNRSGKNKEEVKNEIGEDNFLKVRSLFCSFSRIRGFESTSNNKYDPPCRSRPKLTFFESKK